MNMTRCWKSTVRTAVAPVGILLAVMLAGCGGSAVTGGGTTAVTVTIGGGGAEAAPATASPRATPRPLAATIPPTVTAIRFTISGAGIDNIVQTVAVTGATLSVTLQVPSGPSRTILVEALDSGGVSHFRGATVIDAAGVPLAVTINMAIDPSNPALQTWTVVDNTASSTLKRIVEGDGVLITGGAGGEILSSDNGRTWTSIPSRKLDLRVEGLAFGNRTFLAMNTTWNATSSTYTNDFVGATSDNVADWTPRGAVVTDNPLANLAFGGGTFVAVGDNNTFHSQDNGATWSRGTISGVPYLSDVVYGNGRFVAIDGWSGIIAVSADGISWTSSFLDPSLSDSINGIRFGGGLFLVATSAGNVFTSADGVAWQQRTPIDLTGMVEPSVSSVAYGAGGFLVIVSDLSVDWIYFTFDQGDHWTPVDLAAYGAGIQDGTYFNGAFLLVGDDRGSGLGGVFRSGDL
ncbi:MAG: hypothetical protein ACYC37_02800 [Desulfobacteria bacterium]